ncbi:Gfo/Idh/MocA family protein [Thorsellia anophelis]|uniref:Predicted dehydrogenase n=1 Tax=Thorsellia anophelis DSM 18579 TaxID=1123402 RepID=A0A1H9YY81_9GAMM|nr:Gfo/Idh/MocA family oxidoreductase [Thorsellia anophelis]SES73539.1 Predicted dehydrogenase [Thorsellia anophelis DSM 18579]
MLRLAIIGTNWITHKFVEAALSTGLYQLKAIYSRNKDSAETFASKYPSENSQLFSDLDSLASSNSFDAVYIASPNSLHAKQAMLFMNHGKHVIVEKPMASNYIEAIQMFECAKRNQVILFEAFKTAYTPNFSILKSELHSLGKIRLANLNFCQYSSRYPRYLAGELPNTFNPVFSNGSLMDIGFYCVAFAITLWGKPNHVVGQAIKLDTGVDGLGTATLAFDDFLVNIQHSKISNSYVPSEIQGELGSLVIEHLSECESITKIMRNTNKTQLISNRHPDNTMIFEASYFSELVANKHINHDDILRSLTTIEVITALREQIGVTYQADQN